MFLPLHLITSLFNFYLEMIVGDEAPGLGNITLWHGYHLTFVFNFNFQMRGCCSSGRTREGGRGGRQSEVTGVTFSSGGGEGGGREVSWDTKWNSYKEIQRWWSLDITLFKYKVRQGIPVRQTSWWWLGPVTSNIEWSDTLGEPRTGSRTFNTK